MKVKKAVSGGGHANTSIMIRTHKHPGHFSEGAEVIKLHTEGSLTTHDMGFKGYHYIYIGMLYCIALNRTLDACENL